jgi:hypothetical protein
MKREVWPEGYEKPDWIDNLGAKVPEIKSSWWQGFWFGMLCVCITAAIFTVPDDESNTRRYINAETIFSIAAFFAFASGFAWMLAWTSSCALSGVNLDKEMWLRVLQEKARADSYTRQWTSQEIKELRNCWQWSVNNSENNADKKHEERKKHWLKRWFMKDRPKPFILPVTQYYGLLIHEVEARMGAVSYAASLAARTFNLSLEAQLDAAKTQNIILHKRREGITPANTN